MEKLTEIEIITNLAKKFGNDQDLGKQYRKLTLVNKGKLDEFCLKYPNDFDLGKFLRKKIKN